VIISIPDRLLAVGVQAAAGKYRCSRLFSVDLVAGIYRASILAADGQPVDAVWIDIPTALAEGEYIGHELVTAAPRGDLPWIP
jgi:hypothetical protein